MSEGRTTRTSRGARRPLLGLGGGGALALLLVGSTVLFGTLTYLRLQDFRAYQAATLDPSGRRPWDVEAFDADTCVDWNLDWAGGCRGLPTLCEVYGRRLMSACLETGAHGSYCTAHAAELARTSFGYQACAERLASRSEDSSRFVTEDYCASLMRVLAEHCRSTLGQEG